MKHSKQNLLLSTYRVAAIFPEQLQSFADALKIISGFRNNPPRSPQTRDLRACLKSATFFSNPPLFPQIRRFF